MNYAATSTAQHQWGGQMEQAFRRRHIFARTNALDMDGVRDFFRRTYPTNTDANIAADLGIGIRTVQTWLSGRNEMRARHFFACLCLYGPDFVAAAGGTPLAWLSAARREQQRADLDAKLAEYERLRQMRLALDEEPR